MNPGLYIHVPFCARICPYCDFAVTTGAEAKRRAYLRSLDAEIEQAAAAHGDWLAFETIYFGGGTPSVLPPAQLSDILDAVRRNFSVSEDLWLTLEANPEDVTDEVAGAWRHLGFRSLSLGVQALDDERLDFLGRTHVTETARDAVRAARSVDFDLVSIDLMFGATGQTQRSWSRELEAAIELQPDHISLYQLTYHEDTPFWKWLQSGRRAELPEPQQADLYLQAVEQLSGAGFDAYEVSNFSRGRKAESRHNRKYWEHAPYLGLGPSAHSFDGDRRRWWNHRNLPQWEAALERGESPLAGAETLDTDELVTEAVMFGMRTRKGLDLAEVEARLGVDLEALNEVRFNEWRNRGLVKGHRVLRPTPSGMAIADRLAAEILTG